MKPGRANQHHSNLFKQCCSLPSAKALVAGAILAGCSAIACAQTTASEDALEPRAKLWALVYDIAARVPIGRETFAQLTGTVLKNKYEGAGDALGSTRYWESFEGFPEPAADRNASTFLAKTTFSFRISKPSDQRLGLYLAPDFPCESVDAVSSRFTSMNMMPPPSPPSLGSDQEVLKDPSPVFNEVVLTRDQHWGTMVFSFHPGNARGQRCLASVDLMLDEPRR